MRKIAQPMCAGRESVGECFIARKIDKVPPYEFLLAAGKIISFVGGVISVFPGGKNSWVACYPRQSESEIDRRKGKKE